MQKVTIFLSLSRPWRVRKMAEQIKALRYPKEDLSLVIIIDNWDITRAAVKNAFGKEIDILKIHSMDRRGASEANVGQRRNRIAEVLNTAREFIPDKTFVFGLEDDTDFEPDALETLITDFDWIISNHNEEPGIVSGVQAGRWAAKIVGAWEVDDIENPKTVKSVQFSDTSDPQEEEVDTTGLYCFIVKSKHFKAHQFEGLGFFGPDFYFGLELRQKGFQNWIDWSVECDHVKTPESRLKVDKNCVSVTYKKERGKWKLQNPDKIKKKTRKTKK